MVDLFVSNCDTIDRFVFDVDPFGSCAWSLFVSFARQLLCLVVVFTVGNDAADIYLFTNPFLGVFVTVPLYCTVDMYLFLFCMVQKF